MMRQTTLRQRGIGVGWDAREAGWARVTLAEGVEVVTDMADISTSSGLGL
jgi:hypothetical protein